MAGVACPNRQRPIPERKCRELQQDLKCTCDTARAAGVAVDGTTPAPAVADAGPPKRRTGRGAKGVPRRGKTPCSRCGKVPERRVMDGICRECRQAGQGTAPARAAMARRAQVAGGADILDALQAELAAGRRAIEKLAEIRRLVEQR